MICHSVADLRCDGTRRLCIISLFTSADAACVCMRQSPRRGAPVSASAESLSGAMNKIWTTAQEKMAGRAKGNGVGIIGSDCGDTDLASLHQEHVQQLTGTPRRVPQASAGVWQPSASSCGTAPCDSVGWHCSVVERGYGQRDPGSVADDGGAAAEDAGIRLADCPIECVVCPIQCVVCPIECVLTPSLSSRAASTRTGIMAVTARHSPVHGPDWIGVCMRERRWPQGDDDCTYTIPG